MPASYTGSGPAAGVLEVSVGVKSVAAFKNYKPSEAVEFVFDSSSRRFAVGKPKPSLKLSGSPHQQLAQLIDAGSEVVGGLFRRDNTGIIVTNELSGHYWQNWTPALRVEFVAFLESMTSQRVKHS